MEAVIEPVVWRSIKVSAEARAWPLWVYDPNLSGVDNVDPASPELGLTPDLARDLTAWQHDWDAIFDWDDPGSAAFPTNEAERLFYERGWELARRVRRELDENWDVTYSSGSPHGEVDIRNTSTLL
ncbi:hypothetical protein AB0F91_41055 [Amycolatopsis sp. NPDC023774]|uniref:hypothetical protein n=1 Tax=Amycolatopsis sp. NPDC023774 TaxID=3155015 RepID=UPI0033CE3F32